VYVGGKGGKGGGREREGEGREEGGERLGKGGRGYIKDIAMRSVGSVNLASCHFVDVTQCM
jgi:hypothetical protein